MRFSHGARLAFLGAYCCAAFPANAYAYLDPGSGSYLFQLGLGFLLGALFAVKVFWNNILSFIKRLFRRNPQ